MAETTQLWASDWKSAFEQNLSEKKLKQFVGYTITGDRPPAEEGEERRGFTANIVGYDIAKIFSGLTKTTTKRFALISDEGLAFPIYRGMTFTWVDRNDEDAD